MEGPFSQIPPEILQEIFQRVVPPSGLLDPTECLTLHPIWNRVYKQKKALTLVCRAWHGSAIRLLYEDVCLFRVHQLFILVQSLESLGNKVHIKTLHITPFIPDQYLQSFHDLFRRVISLSPSMDTLDLSPGTILPDTFIQNLSLPLNLTYLNLGPLVAEDIYEHIIGSTARTLTRLTLYNFEPNQPVDFPSLVELNLWECRNGQSPVLPGYNFPCLERATFVWSPFNSIPHNQQLQIFCREHGEKLKMLQIQEALIGGAGFYKHLDNDDDYIMLQTSLDLCPFLEHIVLHPHAVRGSLHHPNVRWVDIWEPPIQEFHSLLHSASRWVELKKDITKEAFPQLRGIRTIASVLRPLNPSVPLVFPPHLSEEPGLIPFSIEFEDLHVQHDVGRIYSPPYECFDSIYDSDAPWSSEEGSDYQEPETKDGSEEEDEEYTPSDSEGTEDEDDHYVSSNASEEILSYVTWPEYDDLIAQFSSLGV